MEMEYTAQPCPYCHKCMIVKRVSALGRAGMRHWYYFLYCSQCGYGPTHAFDTTEQAIQNWNENVLMVKKHLEQHYPKLF